MTRTFGRLVLVLGAALMLLGSTSAVAAESPIRPSDRSALATTAAKGSGEWTLVKGSKYGPTAVFALGYLANNSWVSAELGYGGDQYAMLRARAGAVGPWEWFDVTWNGSYWNIRSTANNLFVSAELGYGGGYYGMLRARAGAVGPWEQFNLYGDGTGRYAWQSAANGLFVSEELGYGGDDHAMLRARAGGIGPWEVFIFAA